MPKKPKDLISEDKMVAVIYDMALVSAAKGVNRVVVENSGIQPNDYVYSKHGIDSTQFVRSNNYYAYDVKTYQAIYERVKTKLLEDKKHFNVILQKEARARDSLNKLNRRKRDSILKSNASKDSINLDVKQPRLPESADSSQ